MSHLAIMSWPLRITRLLTVGVRLALGQIWANKTRSILATLGIVIGIASVTAVIAALTGLKENVLTQFETFGVNKMFIWPEYPDTGPKADAPWRVIRLKPSDLEGMLVHTPSVAAFTRVADINGAVNFADEDLENAAITGIDTAWHEIEQRPVSLGRPFSVTDEMNARPVCLITEATRDELRMPRDPTGESIYMMNRRFTVIGIVDASSNTSAMFGGGGGVSYEVFIPFSTLYRLESPFMYVIANAREPEVANEARAEVRAFLRRSRRLAPDEPDTFGIEVMGQYLEDFKQLAAGVTAVAGGIVSVSLLVGGVGIMNIMLVSVSERTREIGLRKALGARPSAILLQFLIESITLCAFGGLIGVASGQGLVMIIQMIPNADLDKATIPLWAVLMALGFSSVVGIVFGLFPAIKAARLNPIEALRHE